MGMHVGRTGNTRTLRSRLGTALGLGSAAALVIAGVALVGVLPAAAVNAALSFTSPPSSVLANAATTYTVAFTGATTLDNITLSSSNCTLSPSGNLVFTTSGAAGNATFANIVLSGASTGACALLATDTPTGGTATANVTVTPAAASKLAFTTAPPATAGAGVVLTTFKVSSEDQYGNLATGATDTVGLSSSCTLGGTTSVAEVAGVATFSAVSINQVGSCILIASDTLNNAITATSSSAVTVSGGTPAKLAFSVAPPATVAATGTLVTAFKVAVEDASGNIDTTGTGSTDAISISSPCLAAPVSATAIAGAATFSTVEFATTGSCTLTATDTTRVIAAATATSQVGTPQAALTVTSKTGYLDAPLTLAATGGSGTGALTFSVTNGTATGCLITTGVLSVTKAGTCIVTALKAAAAPYASGISAATTVTISSAPHAVKLAGTVRRSHKENVTVSGYNFSGRPKVASNVSGFSAIVTRDTGKSLVISITVKTSVAKPGVKVLTLTFANGTRTSVRYSLH
jgi:hypothetical protein